MGTLEEDLAVCPLNKVKSSSNLVLAVSCIQTRSWLIFDAEFQPYQKDLLHVGSRVPSPPTIDPTMRNVALYTIRQHLLSRWSRRYPYPCSGRPFGSSFDRPKLCLLVGSLGPQIQHRGAKSRATVQLDELPNSTIEPCIGLPEQQNAGPTYPTVVQQALNNMRRYEKCVLLTRVGSFYEVGRYFRKRSHSC